jgi:hypothetical protein
VGDGVTEVNQVAGSSHSGGNHSVTLTGNSILCSCSE